MKNIFKIALIISIFSSFSFAFFGAGFGMGYSFGVYKPKKGFWTEYIMVTENGEKNSMKTVFAGETTYKGKKAYVVEVQMRVEGQTVPSMTIFEAKTYEPLKVATQTPMGLMCFEEENYPMAPGTYGTEESSEPSTKVENPKEIQKKYPKIKHATYTTPTGKKIKCTVYRTNEGEVWINNKIGIVKIVSNNRVVMYLKDFGNNGRTILSVNKVKGCKPFTMPMMPMGGMPQ